MAATALLRFSQGALVGALGHALKVVTDQPVTIENSNNADIRSWTLTLLYRDPTSTVTVGVLAFSNDGSVPTAFVTPDVASSYRVMLEVWDQPGRSGTPTDIDIRNFVVPLPHGTVMPPQQIWPEPLPDPQSGLAGAKPNEMNFSGQPDGWAGNGSTDGLVNASLRKLDGLSDTGGGGGGDTGVPLSAVMYVDGGTTVLLADQTGGIGAPLATIMAAHDALPPGGGVIRAVAGAYPETLTFIKPIKLEVMGPIHGGGSFSDSTIDGITVTSVSSTTLLAVKGVRSLSGGVGSVIQASGSLTGEQSSGIFQGADVTLSACVNTGGTLTCATLKAKQSLFLNNITASGTVIELNDCRFKDSGPQSITFTGSAGTLYVDDVTNYYWQVPTETLVNGTLVLLSTISATATIPTDTLVGRDTVGTGVYENISVGGGIEFTGSLSIQRSALTGDISAPAGSNATSITNNAITFTKLQDISNNVLIGRDAGGTGDPMEISLAGGLEFTGLGSIRRSALSGDITASAGSNVTSITNGAVTDAKLRNSAGTSVIGRASGTSGTPTDIVATADNQVLIRIAGALTFAPVTAATIPDGSVTFPKIQNIPTDSLIGRDTPGSGPPESITLGTGLEFTGSQTIQRSALTGDVTAPAGSNATTIANNAVTFGKMQDIATLTLIGRNTAGTGDPEAITVTGGLEFTGAGGIQRSALTGDVTAPAGSNVTTIAANAVTDTKLRTGGANTVIGRASATTGNVADIAAGTDTVLGRNGSNNLAFTQVQTTMIANSAITLAKMANMNTSRLLGRNTAGVGAPEEITVGGGLEFTGAGGIQRSALTGDVTSPAGSNVLTIVGGSTAFALTGSITPPTITVDQNDYNPTGLATASFIRLSSNATRVITGLAGGASGRLLYLMNVGTNLITFADSNVSSTAANRFLLGSDLSLPPNNGLLVEYDATDSRWRKVSVSLSIAGGLDIVAGGLERSALTGDVTAPAGSNVTQISLNAVANGKLADMPNGTIKGRLTAGTGDPEDLTGTQVTTMLDTFTALLKGLVPASGGGTTTFLRADGAFAVPSGTAGGANGQVQYNNGGALDGASGISVVASETAFAFGGTTSVGGLLNFPQNSNILFGMNNAGSQPVPLVRWGSPSPVSLVDGIYIGSTSGDLGKVANMRFGIHTGGAFQWEINGAAAMSVSSTIADFKALSATFGSVPAAAGVLRFSGNTAQKWRNLSGTPNTFDVQGIAVDASDNVIVGDNTNGTALYLDCKTGGTVNVRVGSSAYNFSTNTLAMNGQAITFGGAPAASGDIRVTYGFSLKALGTLGTTYSVIQAAQVAGTDNSVLIGDNTANKVECWTATGGSYVWRVNSAAIAILDATALALGARNITHTTGFHSWTTSGAGSTAPAGDGLLRFATSPNTVIGSRNYDNTGDQQVLHVAGDGSTFNDVRLGDGGTKGHTTTYLRSKSQVVIEIATVQKYKFFATNADFTDSQIRFGSNPSTNALINTSYSASGTSILAAKDSGGTARNLIGMTSLDIAQFGSGLITTQVIGQGNTWQFGTIASFPGVGHNIATGGFLSFGTASASGLVRSPNAVIIVSAKSAASGDLSLLATDVADELILGGTNVANILATVSTGSYFAVNVNTTTKLTVNGTTLDVLTNNIKVGTSAVVPSAPASGGFIYSEGGAGKWVSPSGTRTTFGLADPHCPRCGADFAHEWESPKYGKLSYCSPCLIGALERAGVSPDEYVIERRAA